MSEEQETIAPASLFEQLGGAAAVDAAVDIFYRKVLSDYRINRFFDNSDNVFKLFPIFCSSIICRGRRFCSGCSN